MSVFTTEVADLAINVSTEFGDLFTLFPFVKAADRNAPDIADLSRVQTTFTGVFLDVPMKPAMPHSYDAHTDQRPGTMAGGPRVDIMPDQITSGLVVQVPDIFQSQTTGKNWRVTSISITKTGICRCHVNLVG